MFCLEAHQPISKDVVVVLYLIDSDDVDGHIHFVISDKGSVHRFERSDTCKSLLETFRRESLGHSKEF